MELRAIKRSIEAHVPSGHVLVNISRELIQPQVLKPGELEQLHIESIAEHVRMVPEAAIDRLDAAERERFEAWKALRDAPRIEVSMHVTLDPPPASSDDGAQPT